MPDYNIYIHAVGGSSASEFNPTVPWGIKEQGAPSGATSDVTSWGNNQEIELGMISSVANTASNPDSLIQMGVSALAKAFPWVAVAIAVVMTAEKIYSTCLDFSSLQSGDYSTLIGYNNFKANINSFLHPYSTTMNRYRENLVNNLDNDRKSLQRALLGDSVINQSTKGV